MTTYFDLIKDVATELDTVKRGIADSGSTDQKLMDSERTESADHFGRGMIMMVDTTDDAAPEGEIQVVQATGNTVGEYTTLAAFTAAIEDGDTYHISPGKFPLNDIKLYINRVIASLNVTKEDTSLEFADDTLAYALPTGVTKSNILQVWFQIDDDPVKRAEHAGWRINSDYLELYGMNKPSLYDENEIIIKYKGAPDALSALTDTLNSDVYQDIVIFGAAQRVLRAKIKRENKDPKENIHYMDLVQAEREAIRDHPIWMATKPFPTSGLGHGFYNSDL